MRTDARFHGLRVLLVEDNPIHQRMMVILLEKIGVGRIAVFDDGAKAIEALKAEPYDIVLMDCRMPIMGGYEATQIIRNPESGVISPHIPIISITANAMEGDREKCLAAGMDDYLAKPVLGSQLEKVLARWTGKVLTEFAL